MTDLPYHGRSLEELEVGAVIPHALTRTVTESDNVQFTTMTMNPARLHLAHHYAANETEFATDDLPPITPAGPRKR